MQREESAKWQDVITHHTPGRTRRADRRHKEEVGRCTRPEPPGGWWVSSHAGVKNKHHADNKQGGEETWSSGLHNRLQMCVCERVCVCVGLTAEYIMNLRGLPCSAALEKFLRMAFSRTPGKLTHRCVNGANEIFPNTNTIRLTLLSTFVLAPQSSSSH